MPEVFIAGHGYHDPAKLWVQVPVGLTVVFYADFDAKSASTTSSAVLSAGDVSSRQEYAAGNQLPNYRLKPLEDESMANRIALVSSRLPGQLYLVGANAPVDQPLVYLCTQPTVCNAQTPGEQHLHASGCKGIFAHFAEPGTRVHLLACRGRLGAPYGVTLEVDAQERMDATGAIVRTSLYGDSPTALTQALNAELRNIYDLAAADPQAAMAYVQSLPEGTRAILRAFPPFIRWQDLMHRPLDINSDSTALKNLADVIASRHTANPADALRYWRALPEPTRLALTTQSDESFLEFLNANNIPVPRASGLQLPLHPQVGPTPPPADFATAWADQTWRNAFWHYLTTYPPNDLNIDNLLQLHQLLHSDQSAALPLPTDWHANLPLIPGSINPHPSITPNADLTLAEEIDYFFTHHWNSPPADLHATAVELHHLLHTTINAAPRMLDPDLPATNDYLVEYRRIHADNLDPAYTPPEDFDPNYPDPHTLASDPALRHWTWAHTTRDYSHLTHAEQTQLSAWVYDTDLDDYLIPHEPTPEETRELIENAKNLIRILRDTTHNLLQDLYIHYRNTP